MAMTICQKSLKTQRCPHSATNCSNFQDWKCVGVFFPAHISSLRQSKSTCTASVESQWFLNLLSHQAAAAIHAAQAGFDRRFMKQLLRVIAHHMYKVKVMITAFYWWWSY